MESTTRISLVTGEEIIEVGDYDPANPMYRHSRYLLDATRPWESLAHFQSIAKWRTIVKETDAELIERYWALCEMETHIEGVDNLMHRQPGHSWPERAQQKNRDAAIELELSAVMLEFEARFISEHQVNEGAP